VSEIIAKMHGPFGLIGENNLFQSEESFFPGIYFFTFEINNKILIEYIGITTRNFNKRFSEHIKELWSGGYQIYDFEKLENHQDFVIWKGRYGKDVDDISLFSDEKSTFSRSISKQIEKFKIYLIPLDRDKRILERIEGKLYEILRGKNNKIISTFIKGVKSNPRYSNEKLLDFEILNNSLLQEIPSKFTI
jgi:hypothetical protein